MNSYSDRADFRDILAVAKELALIESEASHLSARAEIEELCDTLQNNPGLTEIVFKGSSVPLIRLRRISRLENTLALEGLPFLINAYRIALMRNPDASGLLYYWEFCKGRSITKLEFIKLLRESEEGKKANCWFLDADRGRWAFGKFWGNKHWGGREFPRVQIAGGRCIFQCSESDDELARQVDRCFDYVAEGLNRGLSEVFLRFGKLQDRVEALMAKMASNEVAIGQVVERAKQTMANLNSLRADMERLHAGMQRHEELHAAMAEMRKTSTDLGERIESVENLGGILRAEANERESGLLKMIAESRTVLAGEIEELGTLAREADSRMRQSFEQLEKAVESKVRLGKQEMERLMAAQADTAQLELEIGGLKTRIASQDQRLDKLFESQDKGSLDEFCLVDAPALFSTATKNSDLEIKPPGQPGREDAIYLAFENIFYDSDIVRRKQSLYVPFVREASEPGGHIHLDLGCGRGEFLQLLREEGIGGEGVEMNAVEARTLEKAGFRVHKKDLFEFLSEDQRRWSSISMIHVIEHLNTSRVIDLFDDLSDRLRPGGVLIIETINPHCPLSFGSFYMDHTHVKPYAPEVIAFHMQRVGLRDVKLIYSNLIHEAMWTKIRERNYHDCGVVGFKL